MIRTTIKSLNERIDACEATIKADAEDLMALKVEVDTLKENMKQFRIQMDALALQGRRATYPPRQSYTEPGEMPQKWIRGYDDV